MKKDFVLPIAVLMAICLVISAALALTNSATEPKIAADAAARAEAARTAILPDADGFELMDVSGLPVIVTEVYRSTNDVGFVFMLTTNGYGGEMDLICAIAPDGTLVATKTLVQAETKGLGSKITEAPFESQFPGQDASLSGVDMISGATISSKAYIGAIEEAFAAFELVKEAQS